MLLMAVSTSLALPALSVTEVDFCGTICRGSTEADHLLIGIGARRTALVGQPGEAEDVIGGAEASLRTIRQRPAWRRYRQP